MSLAMVVTRMLEALEKREEVRLIFPYWEMRLNDRREEK